MSDYKTYASFNSMTIAGRVASVEIKEGQYGEYASITLYTELVDDGETIAVQFTNKDGLLTMVKNGTLAKGRRLTVTGHMTKFEVIYFDKATGKYLPLRKPRLTLKQAVVFDGGLGATPKEKTMEVKVDAPIDMAPPMEDASKKLASVGA